MYFADLQEALKVLGLGERATIREIKAHHRALVKRHHPDTGNGDISGQDCKLAKSDSDPALPSDSNSKILFHCAPDPLPASG